MKKLAVAIIAVVVVGGGVTAGVLWLQPKQPANTPNDTESVNESPSSTPSSQEPAPSEVTVRMKNTAFSPQTVTVKKGGKVTWVNDDTVQHNVVASDAGNSGGLPTQNSLFGKGGSYSFTFDTAGTFDYHCTPHPFMTGTVIVE